MGVRGPSVWWTVNKGRAGQAKGLWQIGRTRAREVGQPRSPRGTGVCQDGFLGVGSTEKESWGSYSG